MTSPEKAALNEPATAVAASGYFLVDHPHGVALTFTPAAALGTAEALDRAAREALDQDHASPQAPIRHSIEPKKG